MASAYSDSAPSKRSILEAFEKDYLATLRQFENGEGEGGPSRRGACIARVRSVLGKLKDFYGAKVELYDWTRRNLEQSIDIEKVQLELESERQRVRQLLAWTAPGNARGPLAPHGTYDVGFLDGNELEQHQHTEATQGVLKTETDSLLRTLRETQAGIEEARRDHDERLRDLKAEVGTGFANDCHRLERGADLAQGSSGGVLALEQQLMQTTCDYLGLRLSTMALERSVLEEMAESAEARRRFQRESQACAEKVQAEVSSVARAASRRVEENLGDIHTALRRKRIERVVLLEDRQAAAPMYDQQILELQRTRKEVRGKLRRLQARQRMDVEGYTRDVSQMQRELESLVAVVRKERLASAVARDLALHA